MAESAAAAEAAPGQQQQQQEVAQQGADGEVGNYTYFAGNSGE